MTKPPLDLLEEIAEHHDQSAGFTPRLIEIRAQALDDVLPRGGAIIDLGCADGILTGILARGGRQVLAVDASARRVERTRANTKGLPVEVVQSFFEDLDVGDRRFDAVVLACILEHLDDPVSLLRRCASWLADGGVVAAVVPHGRSLHRRAGVHMGMLPNIEALGEADDALDHKRVYTIDMLSGEFAAAGLRVTGSGGILLKPLPNSKMAELPPALIGAYAALGRELPDLAAEIWVTGTPA